MFSQLIDDYRKKWEDNGLMILVIISIVFLLVYAGFRIGKQGSFSEHAYESIWISESKPKHKNIRKKDSPGKDSAGEIICREYLQRRFGRPFDKIRPDFLKNNVTGGYNLELDCYNSELRLAVEYNGIQHYKYTPYFHRNKEAFLNQKYRDEMKKEKCKFNRVHLIEVPYTIPKESIGTFLESELLKLGF